MSDRDLMRQWGLEPDEPDQPGALDPPARRRPTVANWILAGLIAGFGVVMFAGGGEQRPR